MQSYRTFCVSLAMASFLSAALMAQSHPEMAAFAPSARRTADAPPPGPPELPAATDGLATLTLEERIEAPRAMRRTVSRTANRIHIAFDDGREWLFVRNPVEPRRAMGYLVDHQQKHISTYSESDLRNAVGIRGWADVLSLGFDSRLLDGLTPTAEERMIGDVRFVRYAGDAGEVWWSDEQLLAAQVDLHAETPSAAKLTLDSVRAGVDESLLQAPTTRFPDYREESYADSLEDR